MAERPTGVTVICILGFLGAILEIVGGLGMVALGGLFGGMSVPSMGAIPGFLAGMFGIFGAILLILGIASFVVIFWLWKMKKIGWTLTMILEIIGILLSLVSFNIIGIVIPVIIVIYLWLKKDLFK
jgi:hypothetical protein